MRLLKYEQDGELNITSFDDSAPVPPYAILSHTWGADAEEVTFAELGKGDGEAKHGYEKIRFCGQQVQQDNLQYFWVDTCCIDKTDKAELSHALQSMFRWYQNATKCYVYLSDVSTRKRKFGYELTDPTWEPAFRSSRWFKRGWTLQELLAPSTVEFFSQEGERLGDKISLKLLINKITGIPQNVLDGAPLFQFSVNERLRWKEDRVTGREEDGAYSLQGIFGVELAPVYGEGAASAFRRLMDEIHKQERCISDIRSTNPRDDKRRIEETKGGLLADSYRWVLDNATFQEWQQDEQSQLLWIKGGPGKGKTMLLCGIIDELQNSVSRTIPLLSYFFCQATDSRINSATAVLRGLLYMLVDQQPSLVSHVRKKHDHAGRTLFEDANAWIALTEIFVDVLRDPSLGNTCLIIDALDECVTDRPKLLEFIARQSKSQRVKWIVSSRNWPDIEAELEKAGQKIKLSLELNAKSVAAAVDVFIQQKAAQLAQEKQYKAEIRHAVVQHLTSNANGTFLWVALVCQDLRTTANRHVLKKLASFPPGLDHLYARMIDQIRESEDAETCQQVLALAAIVYRPVTIPELIALAKQLEDVADDLESVREIIGLCGSFLTLEEDTVYFVHQSAKDFLFTKACNEVFPDGTEKAHQEIFSRSLAILSRTLQRDMYSLQAPGFYIANVQRPDPDPLAVSRYPCIFWIDHLHDSNNAYDLQATGVIYKFLKEKYLYWLEGLSLCESVGKGIVSMTKLWLLVQEVSDQYSLTQLVQDAWRFIMYHKGAIESYPLQTYASALLFSPTGSLVKQLFQYEEPKGITIKPAISDNWSACLQTLEGHTNSVTSVAFSHDRAQLASGSHDNTVKIWDASSGACLQTLVGHSDGVNSVAFSRDGAQLASGSWDKTVKIWDASSGACLQTLEGHTDNVTSVAFSHDGAQLASGSWDNTIKIWDASSGACLQTLEGHTNSVTSVAFSHDRAQLASGSHDNTVKIWDASSGACLQTLVGHSDGVNSVAFSRDGAQLASGSWDKTVKIWDASSGACLQTLEGHTDNVTSVAFSHDGAQLASGSWDNTVKIWDASSGACLQTLVGHSDGVNSVAFSRDGAQLASGSWDKTVKIWDASSGACLQTLEGHSSSVTSVAFSHDRAQLASGSHDNTVKIWDASSGACLQTLEGYGDLICPVAFSHDGVQLASGSWDDTVKIWDTSSGACMQTLEGHSSWISLMAFSHDGAQLASVSGDYTIKIWDVSTGACLQTLEDHNGDISTVVFSYDGTQLASGSYDNTVKIWDASSGACLQTLEIGKALKHLSFSPSGSALYTEIGTVVIQCLKVSNVRDAIEFEPPLPIGIGISLDDIWITYNGNKMLWLPSEYRPSYSSVCGNMIGIGVGSGRVWICHVDL